MTHLEPNEEIMIRIDHDCQALDIMNAVNSSLYKANTGYQFTLEDEESDEPFLEYYLKKSNKQISY